VSLADVAEILKHDYKDLGTLLNNTASPVASQIERTTEGIVGDYAVIAMEVGREFGIGSRLEGDTLPPGRSVPPKQAVVKVKGVYGRYRIGAREIDAMKSNVGAFTTAEKRRVRNLLDGATREMSRQTWGNGSGRLVTCGVTANSTTVVLAATTADQALVNLAEGMQVDIGTDADPQAVASSRKIVSVNFAAATVVIDGAPVTTTGSHFLYRQGSGGEPQTATQREITGLARHIDDDTTDQGLDPSTTWAWAAIVDGNGGTNRPGSENLIERVVHKHSNRSGASVDVLVAGDGVFRAQVNSLKGRQRVVNNIALKGGHSAIDYTFGAESMPLLRDKDMTPAFPNSLAGIEYASLKTYIGTDWGWEDRDGSVLRLATDDTHFFEAIYFTFRELGCEARNHNFRIDDLETA
jgi:hypothetical protein